MQNSFRVLLLLIENAKLTYAILINFVNQCLKCQVEKEINVNILFFQILVKSAKKIHSAFNISVVIFSGLGWKAMVECLFSAQLSVAV